MFYKNFAKVAGKHLCQRLFFNKVAGLRFSALLKRDSGTGVFLQILRNLLRAPILQNSSDGCFWSVVEFLCENGYQLTTNHFFKEKFHQRCLKGFCKYVPWLALEAVAREYFAKRFLLKKIHKYLRSTLTQGCILVKPMV